MTRILILLAILFSPSFASAAEPLPSVFNGEDFSGWKVPKDNIWWSVKDGVIRGKNDPKLKGSILWSEAEFGDFVVSYEFLFADGYIDSGIFLRKENEQIQLGVSVSLKRDMTGSPYIASKRGYPVEAEGVADVLKQDDWNQMTVAAIGDHYTVWLNGVQILNYESDTAAESGPIGLQIHAGRDMEMAFRNIRVGEIQLSE